VNEQHERLIVPEVAQPLRVSRSRTYGLVAGGENPCGQDRRQRHGQISTRVMPLRTTALCVKADRRMTSWAV
jgi:hypothetical protein